MEFQLIQSTNANAADDPGLSRFHGIAVGRNYEHEMEKI
jgi:hypothetical protein